MGGVVSDLVGTVGDVAQGALETAAPYAGLIGAASGIPGGALIGSALGNAVGGNASSAGLQPGYFGGGGGSPIVINAAPQQQGVNYGGLFASLLPSLIQGTGGVLQGQTSKEAAQKAADLARQSGASAAQMATFRPVGTTTRFGTSNFQVDPTTGQLTSAGYTPSATTEAYQKSLGQMTNQGLLQGQQIQGLAGQYLGESPEAVRQRYVQQQSALLAPGQEQALAGIRNNLFQTGRTGLATGATQAGGLMATNPELAAYYNSLANQQRQIAAGAEQAAQQQVQFGQQLGATAFSPFTAGFGAQSALETAAQQPLLLGSQLGQYASQAGAQAGQLGMRGDLAAANAYMTPEYQLNPLAKALGSLGQSSLLGGYNQATGQGTGLLGGLSNVSQGLTFGGNAPAWTMGSDVIPESTFSGSTADNSWMNEWWM